MSRRRLFVVSEKYVSVFQPCDGITVTQQRSQDRVRHWEWENFSPKNGKRIFRENQVKAFDPLRHAVLGGIVELPHRHTTIINRESFKYFDDNRRSHRNAIIPFSVKISKYITILYLDENERGAKTREMDTVASSASKRNVVERNRRCISHSKLHDRIPLARLCRTVQQTP